MTRIQTLIERLPEPWTRNFVRAFEAGRVQKHPQARFVNARGERCVAAALSGAASSAEFMDVHGATFLGSPLEVLSRRFEAGRLTPQALYEECLLLEAMGNGARARVAAR